jgi:hypothetical protein
MKQIKRRDFLKVLGTGAAALSYGYAGGANYPSPVASTMATTANAAEASKVYITTAITPAGLMAAYKARFLPVFTFCKSQPKIRKQLQKRYGFD